MRLSIFRIPKYRENIKNSTTSKQPNFLMQQMIQSYLMFHILSLQIQWSLMNNDQNFFFFNYY